MLRRSAVVSSVLCLLVLLSQWRKRWEFSCSFFRKYFFYFWSFHCPLILSGKLYIIRIFKSWSQKLTLHDIRIFQNSIVFVLFCLKLCRGAPSDPPVSSRINDNIQKYKYKSKDEHETLLQELRKLIGHFLKLNSNLVSPGQKFLTGLQAKLHYLKIISELPSYGAKCFSTNMSVSCPFRSFKLFFYYFSVSRIPLLKLWS